ncbi:hypothetical protein LIER_07025 [Lithospermum erythrorhizon]|uniref:RRM domain-containing protein n=1 Tax=Lithospermum erythrorhizon TaxID=34254 RepID=A0AAV3PAZ1_LITER
MELISDPRGFGFVQYLDPDDVVDAKHHMDGKVFQGRQLTVVFAEKNRKKPTEMRARDCGRNRVYDRRRSPPRSISPLGKRYVRERRLSRDYRERSFSPSPASQGWWWGIFLQSRGGDGGPGKSLSLSRSRSRILDPVDYH